MSEPDTYIWRCERGDESAVSEETMRQAIAEPRCQLAGCNGTLGKRLRPYPPSEEVDRFTAH